MTVIGLITDVSAAKKITLTTMRKRLHKKKRSCSLCKPHKTGNAKRLDGLALQTIKEFEREKINAERS